MKNCVFSKIVLARVGGWWYKRGTERGKKTSQRVRWRRKVTPEAACAVDGQIM